MLTSLHNDPRFEHMFEHNVAFRQMSLEHKELQREADKLTKALYYSPEMEMKIHDIKKRKLDLKDKMESMLESVAA